jgi:Na+-transporting NADH:ubiquinone oxidoreductase subunit NqrC
VEEKAVDHTLAVTEKHEEVKVKKDENKLSLQITAATRKEVKSVETSINAAKTVDVKPVDLQKTTEVKKEIKVKEEELPVISSSSSISLVTNDVSIEGRRNC